MVSRLPALLALLTIALARTGGPAGADGDVGDAEPRHRAVEAIADAIESGPDAGVARAAWHAGRLGLLEAASHVASRLGREGARPAAERSWVLVQVLLDALVRLDAKPPASAVLPHLDAHPETVVALLACHPQAYAEALRAAHEHLSPKERFSAWQLAGRALAQAQPGTCALQLLREVEIVREVVVFTPHPRRTWAPSAPHVPRRSVERHERPEHYPPVGVIRFEVRGAGRWRGLLEGPLRTPVWREEVAAPVVEVERTEAEDDRVAAARLAILEALGGGAFPPLSVRDEIWRPYAGPTPFARWIVPYRAERVRAWWARVEALVDRGLVSADFAGGLEPRVQIELRDVRDDKHPDLTVPPLEVPNPFAPARPRVARAL